MPTAAILAAANEVFDEVPVRNPGMLAFVPIVDGDLLNDYPVKSAQEGRLHPVPLIIGTNKHEAALFRLIRSPLMPITPHAITSMFTQIAAEQPDLQLPTEEQIVSAYSRVRRKAKPLSIATDVGFRMPSVWLAEGALQGGAGVSVPFRLLDSVAEAVAGQGRPWHRIALCLGNLGGPKDPTLKLGGGKTAKAVSKESTEPVDQLRYAVQAHGPGRRA